MPAVSILLPAWNAAATLGSALASVQRQSLSDWQCIVVDDGSSDDTAGVAHRIAASDARVRVIQTARRGLVAALNSGLECCDGDYIARMDADDVMHRARLAKQVDLLRSDRGLQAVGCHVRIFPRRTMTPRLSDYERWLNSLRCADDVSRDAFVECPVAHPTLMMRRALAAQGYRDAGWPEDYDFVLRTLACGHAIGIVPERLLAWRDRADSASRTDARYGLDRFTACKAFYLAHGFLRASATYVLWGYGDTGRSLRRALAALGKVPSHIVEVKASRLGQRIHGAPVVGVDALPRLRGQPLVVSVARAGPRAEIRRALAAAGFAEGCDFLCAA